MHAVRVPRQAGELLAAVDVPNARGAVARGGQEARRLLGHERRVSDVVGVPLQHRAQGAAGEVPHTRRLVRADSGRPGAAGADEAARHPRAVPAQLRQQAARHLPQAGRHRPQRHRALAIRLLVKKRPDEQDPVGDERLADVRHEARRHLHAQHGELRVEQAVRRRGLEGAAERGDLRVAPLVQVAQKVVRDGARAVVVQLALQPVRVVEQLAQRVQPLAPLEVVRDVAHDVAVVFHIGDVVQLRRVRVHQRRVPDGQLRAVPPAQKVELGVVDGDVVALVLATGDDEQRLGGELAADGARVALGGQVPQELQRVQRRQRAVRQHRQLPAQRAQPGRQELERHDERADELRRGLLHALRGRPVAELLQVHVGLA
mmetsp:Transcript_22590/g.57843  ORF Transcript_22590/g.57843 Transcript_22590/m.57843 type:complete len:374 (-) Transcript_22590:684-1805(-)